MLAGNLRFENHEVIHGHFTYREIEAIHLKSQAPVICWLRHPVDRVISNYHFFMEGLRNPARNPLQYELNKHRISEDLFRYAQRAENRNRMGKFLSGISFESLFFVGVMERFEQDVGKLGEMLDWPPINIPKMNQGLAVETDREIRKKILALNQEDYSLYLQAQKR